MTEPDFAAGSRLSRQEKLRRIWWLVGAIGVGFGFAAAMLNSTQGPSHPGLSRSLLNEAPILPGVAWLLLSALVITTVVAAAYYRFIDEHDRAAQERSSMVALNVYMFVFIGWHVAAKGGLMPAMNHGAIFLVTVGTFMVLWLKRRFL